MTDRQYINYLDLTYEQKNQADKFIFTLGAGLNDKIFVATGDRVEALNNFVYQNRFTPGSHNQFCYNCRKAYPADEPHPDDDCPQEFVSQFKLDCFDEAKNCEGLMTLREQWESKK